MIVFTKDFFDYTLYCSSVKEQLMMYTPGGKNFLCDQNLELPLFLRPIFAKFFLNPEES